MRYENELITSREIQEPSTVGEPSRSPAAAASSGTNKSLETLDEFQR